MQRAMQRIAGSAAALGVLVLTPLSTGLVFSGWPYRGPAVVVGIAAAVALGIVVARLLWDMGPLEALGTLLGSGALTAVATVLSFFAVLAISFSAQLCNGAWGQSWLVLAVVYLAVGLWAFQRPGRVLWAWPLAVLFGTGLMLGVTAVLPGPPGYCQD
jgi:hypothetical protein